MRALLAALALSIAAPGLPAVAAPAGARAETQTDRLVALLVPDAAMSDLAMRTFTYRLAGERGAAEARYPGLKAAVDAKLRPAMDKVLKRELPALRKDIAAILTAQLSPAEIADTETFFASPAGHKVYAAVLRSMGDKPDRSEAEATAAAMKAAMSSLGVRDYPAALRFGATSAARKMGDVNPKIASASRAWADRLIEKHQAKMVKLAKRTTDKFVAKAKGKKA